MHLLEAAVFMEMAHTLDLQGIELEAGINKAEHMERQFREILGISSEEDIEDFKEIADTPLFLEKNYRSFMLQRRAAFWLRLFNCSTISGSWTPVLVTLVPELVGDILDPMVSIESSINQAPSGFNRIPLASIPSLGNLDDNRFQDLVGDLKESGTLEDYQRSLGNVLGSPTDSQAGEQLRKSCGALRDKIEEYGSGMRHMEISVAIFENYSIQSLWQSVDKDAAVSVSRHNKFMQGQLRIICCEDKPQQ